MTSEAVEAKLGKLFWLCFVLGWCVAGFGIWTLVHNSAADNPRYTLELGIGFNIFHDILVAPIACLIGLLVSKLVPKRMRSWIRWGLFSSAIVILIGFIPLRGYGLKPDNPTVAPLDYTTALLSVLGFVWAVVGTSLIFTTAVSRRRKRKESGLSRPL